MKVANKGQGEQHLEPIARQETSFLGMALAVLGGLIATRFTEGKDLTEEPRPGA